VVRGDGIVQYHQIITPFRFIQPLKPSSAVLCKLEQELSLMTSVGNMLYLAQNAVPFSSRHGSMPIVRFLLSKSTI
jgi:hypothetical protein